MRRFIVGVASIVFMVGLFANRAHAIGTFQILNNFPTSTTVIEDQSYSYTLNFLYSGTDIPAVSILGTSLPGGMKVGAIKNAGNGLYSVSISGMELSKRDYPLTIELTDNDGAVLTQPLDFNVLSVDDTVSVTMNSNAGGPLPDAIAGKLYTTPQITISWFGSDRPDITVSGPSWLDWSTIAGASASSEANVYYELIKLYGTPNAVGQFTVTVANHQFTLNVDPNTTSTDNPYGISNAAIVNQNNNGGQINFQYAGKAYSTSYTGTSADIYQIATDWLTQNNIIPSGFTVATTVSNQPVATATTSQPPATTQATISSNSTAAQKTNSSAPAVIAKTNPPVTAQSNVDVSSTATAITTSSTTQTTTTNESIPRRGFFTSAGSFLDNLFTKLFSFF